MSLPEGLDTEGAAHPLLGSVVGARRTLHSFPENTRDTVFLPRFRPPQRNTLRPACLVLSFSTRLEYKGCRHLSGWNYWLPGSSPRSLFLTLSPLSYWRWPLALVTRSTTPSWSPPSLCEHGLPFISQGDTTLVRCMLNRWHAGRGARQLGA